MGPTILSNAAARRNRRRPGHGGGSGRRWLAACLCATPLFGAYESALAPYPAVQDRDLARDVEWLLARIEENAARSPHATATVTWESDGAEKLDEGRDRFGPFSSKSCPNWHAPGAAGRWARGEYVLRAAAREFTIEKPADAASGADWWWRFGEHIVARKYAADWPFIWRLHHDALEADMLGYCEGLGLVLWALQGAEYLMRAENLTVEGTRDVGGVACRVLVATPEWIRRPPFLQNRTHFPFNHSTMLSWAALRPVIAYAVDADAGLVRAAEFTYYDVGRSGPDDWHAVPRPSGVTVRCAAEDVAQNEHGTWYPTRIQAHVHNGDRVVRTTRLAIRLGPVPPSPDGPRIPEGKRMLDYWPLYRPEAFEAFIADEGRTHANLVGLARSLCYEGAMAAGEGAMREAVANLEADRTLLPATFGGIDWELGFAVYELFWRFDEADVQAFWNRMPRTATWSAILARAVDLYQQYRPAEAGKMRPLLAEFEGDLGTRRKRLAERAQWELYRRCLAEDIEAARERNDRAALSSLSQLQAEVEDLIGAMPREESP